MKYIILLLAFTSLMACGKKEVATATLSSLPGEVYAPLNHLINSTNTQFGVYSATKKTIVNIPTFITVTSGDPLNKQVDLFIGSNVVCQYNYFDDFKMILSSCNGDSVTRRYTLETGHVKLDSTGTGLSVQVLLELEVLQ